MEISLDLCDLGCGISQARISHLEGLAGPGINHLLGGCEPMERAGISREVAKKISGHKTDSAYRRYNIVDVRDNEDAGKKLAKFLEGQNV